MAETHGVSCPLGYGSGSGLRQPQTRLDELESYAQWLLDNPGATQAEDAYTELSATMYARYKRLHEVDKLHAASLEARGVWDVGMAVVGRLVDRRFFTDITPHLHEDCSLPEIFDLGPDTVKQGSIRRQALDTFMRVGTAALSRSVRSTLEDLASSGHPHNALLPHLRQAQQKVHDACVEWNNEVERRSQPRPIREPKGSLDIALAELPELNMESAALIAITAGASHCLRSLSNPRTPVALAATMLSDVEYLGRFAGTNVRVTQSGKDILPAYVAASTEDQITAACMTYLDGHGEINEQLGIRDGPRRKSATGSCPANFELSDTDPSDKRNADDFFAAIGVDTSRVFRQGDEAYRGSSVILAWAAYVGRRTLYAAWPQSSSLDVPTKA
jgi:hypothetical protein